MPIRKASLSAMNQVLPPAAERPPVPTDACSLYLFPSSVGDRSLHTKISTAITANLIASYIKGYYGMHSYHAIALTLL